MVDQVTFPPSVGGSGRTYTNDSNPDTGMFNGGHRINFFPMLSDTVAAAGYVAQYAQAIDGAKANADKAEDAKAYVEGVADAYQVNILEAYRAKATLDLDFSRGLYRVDDGTLAQASNAAEVLTFNRSTPKWVEGPDGMMREVAAGEVARHWRNGKPQGASITDSYTNSLLNSSDFSASSWSKADATVVSVSKVDMFGSPYQFLRESDGDTTHSISQTVPVSNTRFSTTFYVALLNRPFVRIEIREAGPSNLIRVNFNLETKTAYSAGAFGECALSGFEMVDHGEYGVELRVSGTFISSITSATATLQLLGTAVAASSGGGYAGDGSSGVYIASAMLNQGLSNFPAYIQTAASPVSSVRDTLYRIGAADFSNVRGTLFFRGTIYSGSDVAALISIGSSNNDNSRFISLARRDAGALQIISNTSGINVNTNLGSLNLGERVAAAISYDLEAGFVRGAFNGSATQQSTSIAVDSSFRTLVDCVLVGKYRRPADETNYADVESALYLPSVLTAAELEELTAL